jgi:hypothetical protein
MGQYIALYSGLNSIADKVSVVYKNGKTRTIQITEFSKANGERF